MRCLFYNASKNLPCHCVTEYRCQKCFTALIYRFGRRDDPGPGGRGCHCRSGGRGKWWWWGVMKVFVVVVAIIVVVMRTAVVAFFGRDGYDGFDGRGGW